MQRPVRGADRSALFEGTCDAMAALLCRADRVRTDDHRTPDAHLTSRSAHHGRRADLMISSSLHGAQRVLMRQKPRRTPGCKTEATDTGSITLAISSLSHLSL